jgi:uncharacterized membrane protein
VSPTKTRGRFQSSAPITTRPEDRIAERTAERRAAAAANRPKLFSRPSRMTGAIMFFAFIGLGIAIYTTVVHYVGPSALACTGASAGHQSSCEQVQFSIYNNVAGIPVAILGTIGYLVILGSLRVHSEYGRAAGFGTALIGFFFSLYLTYREAFSIKHYCEWCLGSATCMTVLTILLGIVFFRTPPAVEPSSVAVETE